MPKHKEGDLVTISRKNNTRVSSVGDFAGKGHSCPFTPPETNSSTLKIDPLEKEIPIGHPTISSYYVSFTECFMTFYHLNNAHTSKTTPPPPAIFPKKIPGTSCTTLPRRSNSMMRMRCKGHTRRNTFGFSVSSDESPVVVCLKITHDGSHGTNRKVYIYRRHEFQLTFYGKGI